MKAPADNNNEKVDKLDNTPKPVDSNRLTDNDFVTPNSTPSKSKSQHRISILKLLLYA